MLRSKLKLGIANNAKGVSWYKSSKYKVDGLSPNLLLDFVSQKYTHVVPMVRTHMNTKTATFHDANGNIQLSTNNALRIDYHPTTKEKLGLLIEGQLINPIRYTEDITYSDWERTGVTATLDASVVNPYGTTGAYFIQEDSANTEHFTRVNVRSGGTGIHTDSVFLKPKTGSRYAYIAAWNSTNGFFGYAVVDLSTGNIVSTGGSGFNRAGAVLYNNGWVRFWCSSTAGSTKSDYFYIKMHNGSSTTYAGDGASSFYVWGAQKDNNAYMTSYVPNASTVASKTRDADLSVMTDLTWFNQSAGTIMVAGRSYHDYQSFNRPLLTLDDNTANEAYNFLFADGSSDGLVNTVVDGGVEQFAGYGYSHISGSTDSLCLGYTANNSINAINENLIALDLAVTLPTPTQMRLGCSAAGNYFHGHIKGIVAFNSRLSDIGVINLSTEAYFGQ